MFSGQAPPFGWYWSASRSRTWAPRSSAIRVTSPVATGWLVESSPRSSASRKQRPPAATITDLADVLAATRSPARARRDELRERRVRKRLRGRALDDLSQRLRDRMAGAVAD